VAMSWSCIRQNAQDHLGQALFGFLQEEQDAYAW
jgi:hypothetical protein